MESEAFVIRNHKNRLPNHGRSIRISNYPSTRIHGSIILSLDASRAGRRNPVSQGASSATSKALFNACRSTMATGAGHTSVWPDLGPVYDPRTSSPPNAVVSIVADSTIKPRSLTMSTSNQGEIRPIADRVEQAQLLIDAASSLLEKQTQIDTAADTLIEAADILLGNHPRVNRALHGRLNAAVTVSARLFGLTMLLNDLCASKYGRYEDSGLEALATILHDETEKLVSLVTDSTILAGPWRGDEAGDVNHE